MRFIFRLLVIGLVALVVLGFAAFMYLDRGARTAVERGVSYALAVPTTLAAVSIHPFAGSVGLDELSIANPEGFSAQPMLDLKEASLRVSMKSLLSDVVEVSSLELSGIHLRLEGRATKTNYGVILANLARFDKPKGEKPKDEEQGTQKRFIIHDLLIRNTTVDADYALDPALGKLGSTSAVVTLPEIHLKDVGNGKSLTLAELTTQIFKALLEAASAGNIPGLSADLAKDLNRNLAGFEELGKDLEGAFKGVKDLFEKKD